MRYLSVIFLAVLLTAHGAAGTADELSCRCAKSMATVARKYGAAATSQENRVKIGSDELVLVARIEKETTVHGQVAIALAVDISANGGPALPGSAVGLGKDRKDALETALLDWGGYTGVAWLRALSVKLEGESRFQAGGFLVYPGLTGIRGKTSWSKEKNEQLTARLSDLIPRLALSKSNFHTIALMVAAEPGEPVDAHCRVDNEISSDAMQAALTFPWPESRKGYIFKQYYVLRPIMKP